MRPSLPILVLAPLLGFASASFAQTYTITDPVPSGVLLDFGFTGMTESNVLLGSGLPVGGTYSGLVVDGTTLTYLAGPPNSATACAYAMNDSGLVVGSSKEWIVGSFPEQYKECGATWSGGIVSSLETLAPANGLWSLGRASDVNAVGDIVGTGISNAQLPVGWLLHQGTLTTFGAWTSALANNSAGQIAGMTWTGTEYHAVRWDNGIMTDLHDPTKILGGYSGTTDIDRYGHICGDASFLVAATYPTAAYWGPAGPVELGALATLGSRALAMNDLGEIVGDSKINSAPPQQRAVLWKNGQQFDLNTLVPAGSGLMITTALDVTNDGRILVSADLAGHNTQWRVLVPVCAGGATAYGAGCPGTGGATAELATVNCPTPGNAFALTVKHVLPNAFGIVLLGSGNGTAPIVPACLAQVLPLIGAPVGFALDGDGELFLPVTVPNGVAPVTVSLQALVADPAGPGGISSSRPIQLRVQ